MEADELFWCVFVGLNHGPGEDCQLSIICWVTDATMLLVSSENSVSAERIQKKIFDFGAIISAAAKSSAFGAHYTEAMVKYESAAVA
jgi:hypothetical protein